MPEQKRHKCLMTFEQKRCRYLMTATVDAAMLEQKKMPATGNGYNKIAWHKFDNGRTSSHEHNQLGSDTMLEEHPERRKNEDHMHAHHTDLCGKT